MRGRLVVCVVALALAMSGCGDDDSDTSTSTTRRDPLPPATVGELRPLFDDELRALGLRLTRGALVDPSEGYETSRTGTHLALYVEPTGPYTEADYVDGIHRVTDIFAPEIFERWPELASFDVCQEPLPAENDELTPPAVTVVNLTRAQAEAIDWDQATTVDVVAASFRAGADEPIVKPSDELLEHPAWQAVARRALKLIGKRPASGGD